MRTIRGAIIGATAILAACHAQPTFREQLNADHGAYPDSFERIVHDYYSRALKDPDAAVFKRISKPITGYLGNRITGYKYGYLVCATLNAKNSYGAYVGYETDALLIRDGAIVEVINDVENTLPTACP